MRDEGYDVYLYHSDEEDATDDGSDDLERGFPTVEEAKAYADQMVTSGQWGRAIVGVGENVVDLYDTNEGWLVPYKEDVPLPDVAPLGPRSRASGLAERLVAA